MMFVIPLLGGFIICGLSEALLIWAALDGLEAAWLFVTIPMIWASYFLYLAQRQMERRRAAHRGVDA